MKKIIICSAILFLGSLLNAQTSTISFTLKQTPILNGVIGKIVIQFPDSYDWPRELVSIEWNGPNGFHRVGGNVIFGLTEPGEYCVKLIDKNFCVAKGCITLQKCTKTSSGKTACEEKSPVIVYVPRIGTTFPSPFHDELTVNVQSETDQEVRILLGNETNPVKTEIKQNVFVGDNNIVIQTAKLPPGVYTLRVIGKDGQLSSMVVIKM